MRKKTKAELETELISEVLASCPAESSFANFD
jgi:hypothetical protein